VETQAQIDPYLDVVGPYLELSQVVQDPMAVLSNAGGLGALSETLTAALGYIGIVGTGLLHLFVMCALAFYLLRDDPGSRGGDDVHRQTRRPRPLLPRGRPEPGQGCSTATSSTPSSPGLSAPSRSVW